MADLDYAFLAEYARVETNGTLTSIGASFTNMTVPELPATQLISVAGRLRSHVDEAPSDLTVTIRHSSGATSISATVVQGPGGDAKPYGDGKIGILFALTTVIPILREGLYEVLILIDSQPVRRLAFEVGLPPRAE